MKDSGKLKILHVETGKHLYGGALQVHYLLRGLHERGFHSVLVCSEGSAIASHAVDVTDAVYSVPIGGDADLRFIARLRRIIRQESPDLVHLHSRRGADVLGGIAARLARVPVVLSRRVDNPEPKWWARRKYRLYGRVVTISEAIADVLKSEGVDASRITCVHSAVDTQRYQPGCDKDWFSRAFEIPPGTTAVGMIAQLIERKGHRYLLQAVPGVIARYPNTRFLLFGRGPLEAEIRSEIDRLDLAQHVRLVGFREDLERILPCLDIVVHPAAMEGLGVSLLQAAACGVPLIGSAAGGIPEIVKDGENGYVVVPGSPDKIAEALSRLLANPRQARSMGEAGRRIAEAHFSIGAMVQGNIDVYEDLLERASQLL